MSVKVNNLPLHYEPYIVARACEGELWYWSSYEDEELAHINAIEVDGIVVYGEEE